MITLRRATMDDWARLYSWRTDPETAAASRGKEPTLREHMKWLRDTLGRTDRALWVAVDPSRNVHVGTCRLDLRNGPRRKEKIAECSLSVDRTHRGRGYAQHMIAAMLDSVPPEWGVTRFIAIVKSSNGASLRAFAANHFTPASYNRDMVTLERARA